jgi:hypothetical protein
MSSHEHTRPRRGRLPVRTQAPEQTAALFGLAIEWRDAWRAEVVARNGTAIQNGGAKPNLAVSPWRTTPERTEAAKFATAITRHEFGRFYWNGKLADQLVQALERRPSEEKTGTSKPASRKKGVPSENHIRIQR